jgi:uncharacterized protein
MLAPDMSAWTTTSGSVERARYQAGIRIFATVFNGGLAYTVHSLTAEEDRVAAEVTSRGMLIDGKEFQNTYVFVLRFRDGQLVSVAEHFNPLVVRELIMPLLQAAMAKAAPRDTA